jgi:hypothetical protein
MTEDLPLDKLRAYLRELKPEARTLLLAELERAAARGEHIPATDFMLQELRRDQRNEQAAPAAEQPDRMGIPARMFFAPLEPFLVDDAPAQSHRGRIIRACLEPVWLWICRELMPSEAKAYSDQISRLMVTNDSTTSERLARAFQDQAVERIREALAPTQDDNKARQRLGGQFALPRAVEHLRDVYGVLRARDALAVFSSRLPAQIKNLADEQLDNVKALLDSPIGGHPDVFVYALVLVMGRLSAPWQLVRLAVRAADSDLATKIVGTPYGIAVSLVLSEMDRMLATLREEIRRGRFPQACELLKGVYDAARLLRTELDLSGDSPWARQLTGMRSDVSGLVKNEIETVPGRVRRLLRPRKASEVRPGAVLDATEVEEVEALLEFVTVCRSYASELAINEVTLRVHSELQNYLESGTSPLLDGLRNSDEEQRAFRLSQVDATVRFASKVFGSSYASLLAKAAEVAVQDGERKAVKA